MALIEMRGATYARGGKLLAGPADVTLDEGRRLAFVCGNDLAARAIAMMASGQLAPSGGTVFVAAFDPRIQPVQVKRIAAYVAHEAPPMEFSSFTRYMEYRAALWGLPRAQTVVRARSLLAKLEGVHEQFAYPLAGALAASPRLLVLDRPLAAYGAQIVSVAGSCAVFSTHATERDAERFEAAGGVLV